MPSHSAISRQATLSEYMANAKDFKLLRGKTMTRKSVWMIAITIAALGLSGCEKTHKKDTANAGDHPATVDKTQEPGIARLTLTPRAAERLGIQTAEVKASGQRLEAPYGALLYDAAGGEWVYTNPEGHVFKRASVKVDTIQGDKMFFSQGPAAGTKVVSVGAAELFGTEFEIGH